VSDGPADATTPRTITVDALARVEGEGALHVQVRDGQVEQVQLRIYEPPRFFEAMLRGRRYTEPPDITARICGICPVAYQMSACQALEAACGVTVDGQLRELRRLLYCGEWIESHVLHIFLLHAPDFLGVDSALALARTDPELVQRALDLKQVGNQLVEVVGGRAVHPVNVRLGGFHRAPTAAELAPVADRLRIQLDAALDTVRLVAGFTFPDLRRDDVELVALRSEEGYAVLDGRLVSSGGLDLGPDEFDQHVVETHVAHSNALQAHLAGRGEYLVGPMARFALNHDRLGPAAAAVAAEVGLDPEERNPFRSIVIRAVEVVHAVEEALAIIDAYVVPPEPAVAVPARAGVGCGWSEAPRGTLWHRYELDGDGTVLSADIVPPTSQNQPAIESDLAALVQANLALDDDDLRHLCEQSIRNYDPCISCATHFLDLTVDRG
jgi:coenzyme F420-reducing hydrogenase alpha subunit